MARNRRPERDKAFQLWLESGKTRALKNIATELGVTDVQVRKWKSQDNWNEQSKGTLSKGTLPKRNVPKQKKLRGAQPGNQNAKGHGAPRRNKNNFKHGLYEELYWDNLDDKEQQMLDDMKLDEEEDLLIEQIKLLTVRERRLLRRIEEQRSTKGGLALESVISRKLEIKGNIVYDNQQTQTETTTRTISTFEVIQKLETELTRVQARKTRCIEALSKMRLERRKMNEESRGSAVANDWISALIDEDEADE